MAGYAARRLLWMIPLTLFASFVAFVAVVALPGDPVQAIVGERRVSEATRRAVEARYQLDEPVPVQYAHWLGNLVQGDLGESYQRRRPVQVIIAETLPNSIRLAALAVAIELVMGAIAGVVTAVTRRSFLDVFVTVATIAAIALPVYVLGSLFQWTFGFQLGWVPAAGTGSGFRSWILPAAVLAIPSLAYATRLLRDGLRREMREPYVTVAATKGIGRRRVIARHALRNASIPVITFLGLDFGVLIGGAIVVEALFDVRGVGFTIVEAVRQHDNPVIIGTSLVLILVFLLVNLAVDLIVAAVDPRVRRR